MTVNNCFFIVVLCIFNLFDFNKKRGEGMTKNSDYWKANIALIVKCLSV
ncbi:MAG: hypothetical protein Rpha_0495 [Candidatus Ruthia sp. Apha_13_S6]|nr:hypothetical protein [Candidatus Ruthia sp. Apha_13_S6]